MDKLYNLVSKYLDFNRLQLTMSDEDVSGSLTTQIARRDKNYTELLEDHIKLSRNRAKCKEVHKWIFFWLIIIASGIGIFLVITLFNRILSAKDIETVIDAIPLIITALVSLVSTVIVVPLTIAKFLFNTKEDDNITTLIKHTQKHDSAAMNLFKDRIAKRKQKNNGYEYIDVDGDEH